MRLPAYFYSLQPEETISFGNQPPGHMNVIRMIHTQPPWQKLRAGFVLKPKTLLINIFAKKSQESAIKEKLSELMALGFTIYWRHVTKFGRIIRSKTSGVQTSSKRHVGIFKRFASPSELSHLPWTELPSLITDSVILPAELLEMEKNNTLLIIQDVEMQALLDNNFTEQELRLSSSDLFRKQFENLSETLISESDVNHRLLGDYLNNLGVASNLSIDLYHGASVSIKGLKNLPTVQSGSLITQACLNDAAIECLINDSLPASTSVPGQLIMPTTLDHFRSMEELVYYLDAYDHKQTKINFRNANNTGPAESPIDQLLYHTPNIKKLKLARLKTNGKWPLMEKLTHLKLGYVYDSTSLRLLLEKCPNLEFIEFKGFNTIDLDSRTKWPKLLKLKTFVMKKSIGAKYRSHNTVIPAEFLKAMPRLERLNTGDIEVVGIPKLNHLKTIHCSQFNHDLAEIMENCPSLNELQLSSYRLNSTRRMAAAIQNCPALTSINLYGIPEKEFSFWDQLLDSHPSLSIPSLGNQVLNRKLRNNKLNLDDFIVLLKKYPWGRNLKLARCKTTERLAFLRLLKSRTVLDPSIDLDPYKIDRAISTVENHLRRPSILPSLPDFSSLFKPSSSQTTPDLRSDFDNDRNWDGDLKGLLKHINLQQALSTLSDLRESGASGLFNTQPQNQAFNTQAMQSYDPEAYNTNPPQYQRHNNLSQIMVIAQLTRFLTLTNKKVPRIQEGICSALAHLSNEMNPDEWFRLLTTIRDWDGEKVSLSPIHYKMFGQIHDYVKRYQLVSIFNLFRRPLSSWASTWMGDGTFEWLKTQSKPVILSNSWHALALRPLKNGPFQYFAYNPNFIEGGVGITHEQLPDFIKASLGDQSQILVEGEHTIHLDSPNPSDFIQHGGLLTLMRARNKNTLLNQLVNNPEPLAVDALEGLFLRDFDGKPAWLLALASRNTHLIHYALKLLTQFIAAHPENYWIQLQKSAELVKGFSLHTLVDQLINLPEKQQLSVEHRALIDELPELLSALNYIEQDRDAFKKISRNTNPQINAQSYPIKLLQSEDKSRLIEMPDSNSIQALRFQLQELAEKTGNVLLYIDTPEALSCSTPFVELQDDGLSGLFREGPGGTLHKALTQGQPPIILINCDGFPKSAMVRFNALIDENPNADGTPLPKGARVIALLNPQNANCYRGRDLYSRFESKEIYPLDAKALKLPELPIRRSAAGADDYIIELFNSSDWREHLLGYWAPRGDRLEFIPGELQKALASGRPVTLANAPWQIREFTEFWQEVAVRGYILLEDQRINLPEHFNFAELEGYNWQDKARCIASCDRQIDTEAQILNPYTMSSFLIQYDCIDASESIAVTDGLLRKYADSSLSLNISHNLTPDGWARFFHNANEHRVNLQLHLAQGVELPPDLEALVNAGEKPFAANLSPTDHTSIILSDAPDTTRAQLGDDYIAIDISECDPSELLDSIDGYFDPKQLRLRFKNRPGLLPQFFENNQRLVLRGEFSADHIQALTPLLQERMAKGAGNQLILLPNNPLEVDFSYFPVQKRQVSIAEKQFYLPFTTLPEDLIAKEDLSSLLARQRYAQAGNTGEDAWLGMHHLPARLPMGEFDAQNSEAITEGFTQARIDSVLNSLNKSPFVFITGLTAVGKSTFVEKELAAVDGIHIHHSEQSIEAWANDTRPGTKILFLDEANLGGRDWSEFEGLFEIPPYIRIKNKLIQLTPEHKVIFAGNPASYGDKRRLSPLFERHGNAVLFEPMPQEYIYEKMLKPLFDGSAMQALVPELAFEFLRVYKFLCGCSVSSVLISPRELQMMALLTLAHKGNEDPRQVAQYYARIIAKDLVPASHVAAFNAEFPPVDLHYTAPAASASSDNKSFLYTPSREPVANLLDDLLNLRELRYDQPNASEDFLYGGLGGIILEGESGVGKTDMVLDKLRERGYLNKDSNRPFYYVPASWNQKAKEKLLLKAFHEGAVVFIDEINSTDLMEDFLNDLLMGKSPDKKRPARPGFLLIGTQNPAAMGGRLEASNALQRRMIKCNIPNYTTTEMRSILRNMGLGHSRAQVLLNTFLEESKKNPELTFRDLIRRAKAILGHQVEEEEIDLNIGPQGLTHFLPDTDDSDAETEPALPAEHSPLAQKIANLKAHGEYLTHLTDPLRQQEGIKTTACAEELEKYIQQPEVFKQKLNQAYQTLGRHHNKASFFFEQKTQRQKIIAQIHEQQSETKPFIRRHLAKLTLTPLVGVVAALVTAALLIAFPIGLASILALAGIVTGVAALAAGVGLGIGALVDHFRKEETTHQELTFIPKPSRRSAPFSPSGEKVPDRADERCIDESTPPQSSSHQPK